MPPVASTTWRAGMIDEPRVGQTHLNAGDGAPVGDQVFGDCLRARECLASLRTAATSAAMMARPA